MQADLCFGIDVAQATLSVCSAEPHSPVATLANNARAIGAFLKRLPQGAVLACEPTNTYHEGLAERAVAAGFTLYLVNPHELVHYRQSLGLRAKTDRIDARILARYALHEGARLRPYRPLSPAARALSTCIRRRAKVVRARAQLRQSLGSMRGVRRELQAVLARIERLIATLDAHIATLIAADTDWQAQHQRLQSIPGVGPCVSAAALAGFARGPFARADAFVAFTGYDLRVRDSGKQRGTRRLSKRGDAELRRLFYVAALSAARTRTWRPYYERYLARGLSRTAALVALARKLVRTTWSIIAHNTTFDPARLSHQCLT